MPHYVPEKNPFVDELTKLFHLPKEAVLGRGRNAVSGVPEEDQGDVRAARALQERLRSGAGHVNAEAAAGPT